MPKDIEPDVLVKDSSKDVGSPKAPKPPILSPAEGAPEAVKFLSPKTDEDAPEGPRSSSPKPAKETPKVSKPLSPSANKETPANTPIGEGSTRPRVEEVPRSSSCITDSLAQDPDFIKVDWVPYWVNTEAEQVDIQAL
jgi:hypothetical protein